MLNAVINWSLHNRVLVLIGAAILAGLGLAVVPELPIDAFPDTTPVQVAINTSAPSLGPLEVERQITFPVEQAISGLPRLDQVRSLSRFGLSQVIVTFHDGTDIYFARQLINERLAAVELPEGINRPRMGPVATGLGEVYHYLVRHTNNDLMEARTKQDWVIRPALRTVPGTAEINSWGGLEKQYQVRIDPQKLLAYDLTFDQVQEAVRRNNLDVGGGHVQRGGSMYLVRGLGRTATVEAIQQIVVATPCAGVPVVVGDVAEVAVGPGVPLGAVTANGRGDVVLGLGFMLMGENPHEVTDRLKKRMEEVEAALPKEVQVTTVYDRTQLVDHIIDTVRSNLFEGGLLVIAVLFIFLGNLRAGLIVALAIPLSMLFAFTGMLRFGIAGSLLSLGAIDFGLIVDSSVVMIENCVRHLSHDKNDTRSKLEAVRDAAIEVRGPTMFGELIIMIVYLPILTLEGVAGKLFRPMALTVIFALVGSMVLSLTLMPVLASLLLPRRMDEKRPAGGAAGALAVRPGAALVAAQRRFRARDGAGLAGHGRAGCCAASRTNFLPPLSEGAFVVSIFRLPGTDVNEALRCNTAHGADAAGKVPRRGRERLEPVRHGRGGHRPDGAGRDGFVHHAPAPLAVEKGDDPGQTEGADRQAVRGVSRSSGRRSRSRSSQRINEMISGVRGAVAVKIFGDDIEMLKDKGEDVEEILKSIRGNTEVSTDDFVGSAGAGDQAAARAAGSLRRVGADGAGSRRGAGRQADRRRGGGAVALSAGGAPAARDCARTRRRSRNLLITTLVRRASAAVAPGGREADRRAVEDHARVEPAPAHRAVQRQGAGRGKFRCRGAEARDGRGGLAFGTISYRMGRRVREPAAGAAHG